MEDSLHNEHSNACKAYATQGNRPGADVKTFNYYAGNDTWQNGIIPHGTNATIYVAQWGPGNDNSTDGTGFFTDRNTIAPHIHKGKIDADELGAALQTMPSDKHYDLKKHCLVDNVNHEGYRPPYVNAYVIDWNKLDSLKNSSEERDRSLYYRLTDSDGCSSEGNDIKCAYGATSANTQFGHGGGNQYYIDKETFNDAVDAGIFRYDVSQSFSESNNTLKRSSHSVKKIKEMQAKAKNVPASSKTPEEINSSVADPSRYGSYIAKPDPAYTQNHQQSAQNADVEKMHGHDVASDQYRRGPPDNMHSENATASETHDDNTHSSDDVTKDNSHADADAAEAKRDSASESKETSKDIASEPEETGAKQQKADSQTDQGNNERASSKINANAADDSLSRTQTANASEKATESGPLQSESGSPEEETGKAQPASEIAANTPEESGQASVTQPDNNLTKDVDNQSPHGQSEPSAQNYQSSHVSSDQVNQSDESRTNNADRSQTLEGEMPHDAVGKSANDGHETSQTNNSVEASENVGRNEHAPSDQEAENTDHQTPHGQTGSTEQHDHPAADTADKNNVAENHKADDTAEKAENNSADAHVEKAGTSQDSALANEPADARRPSASSDDVGRSNETQNTVQSGNQVAEDNAAHDVTRENANGHNETATVSQSEAANGRENAPATSANTSNAEAAKPDAETNHPEREQSSDKASVNAPQEENNTAAAQYNSGENDRNSTPEHQATQEQNPGINSDKAVATPETNTKDRATDQASAAESPKQDSSALAHSAQSTASDSYNREQPSSNTPQRDSTALAGADSQKRNERPEQSNTTGPNVNDHSADKAYENGNTHKEASASQSAYDGNKNGESSDVPDSYRHSDTKTGADESNESTGMQNRWDTQNQRSHSADAENNSDGMPSKGRDTHLSNDATMPPNTYQHNSDQNETAEGMSGSENVAATSDKSDSKASTQNSEVSENSTPRNDDSAQIPNSVDGKDTNSGAEKASGNSLNSSGSTNEFKNNGYQQ